LEEVASRLDEGRSLPSRCAVLTFDDGYEETCTVAWPLLKRFGFPAAVFVTPAEVGLPGFATWEQVARMARDGMTIGSHTMHHSYLPVVPSERLPLEKGMLIYLVAGKHIGAVGKLADISGTKITVKTDKENFETLKEYAFVIGKEKPCIALESK